MKMVVISIQYRYSYGLKADILPAICLLSDDWKCCSDDWKCCSDDWKCCSDDWKCCSDDWKCCSDDWKCCSDDWKCLTTRQVKLCETIDVPIPPKFRLIPILNF